MSYNKETRMYEGYIYKITNIINNKIYIGQTTTTIDNRWKDHKYSINSHHEKYPLQKAFIKYGIENFKIEEIQKYQEKTREKLLDILNAEEKYYINKYESLSHQNGYNVSKGGGSTEHLCKEVYCFKTTGEFVSRFNSRKEAGDFIGVKPCEITYAIQTQGTCKGYYFNNDNVFDYIKPQYKTRFPVDVYDCYGNFIQQCSSYYDASKQFNVSPFNVYRICNGDGYSIHGYIFRFYFDPFEKYTYNKTKKINIYKNNIFLNQYDSIKEAAESIGTRGSMLSAVLARNTKGRNKYKEYGVYYAHDPNQPDKTKIVA